MKNTLWSILLSLIVYTNAQGRSFMQCSWFPRDIDCSKQNLTELPKDILLNTKIGTLNLRFNRIKEILASTFYSAAGLIKLDLSYNEIAFIEGSSFVDLPELISLSLGSNRLASLPFHFLEGLSKLESLDLSHNYLTLLPGDVFEPTPRLAELKMNMNPLASLGPETFRYLSSLEKLYMDHTHLKEIPSDLFSANRELQVLGIAHNLLEEVPHLDAPHLKSLDLSANPIKEIRPNAFLGCPSLTALYIDRNHYLKAIHSEAFAYLPGLKALYCSFNHDLEWIHDDAFRTNGSFQYFSLESFHLRGNALKTLSSSLIPWSLLFHIDLRDNPWRCDCELRWLRTIRLRQNLQEQVRCSSPKRLRNRLLSTVPADHLVCGIYVNWDSVIVLATVLLITCAVATCFALYLLVWRPQRMPKYARIVPLPERFDLEWDDSAEH